MDGRRTVTRPLRIGISSRLMHSPPAVLGFRGKTLLYLEQSIAHWVMAHGAVAFMVPTLGYDSTVSRRRISVREYVDLIDALLLQGGADVSPTMYGQAPIRPEWNGDIVRDRYEIELIEGCLGRGKPVLGICRGAQLINVAYGGTLMQDIATQRPQSRPHVDAALYDELSHALRIEQGTRLATIYPDPETRTVNSIHHQAIDRLGSDLEAEAFCEEDGIVEAIRVRGPLFVAGVQWHPEFHWNRTDRLDPEPLLNAFLDAALARAQL
jgi:putative glutamine amidotransferase